MKSRSIWFLWPLILLPLAGTIFLFLCPKILTGDYAEITIDSIGSPEPGMVEILYHGQISHGTHFSGSTPGAVSTEGSTFAGVARRPWRLEECKMTIYTIRNEAGKLATPQEALGRLSVQIGKTYRIRPGRPLALLRYIASDGDLAEMSLAVWPDNLQE